MMLECENVMTHATSMLDFRPMFCKSIILLSQNIFMRYISLCVLSTLR